MGLSHSLDRDAVRIRRTDGPLVLKLEHGPFGGGPFPFVGAEYPAPAAGGIVQVTSREIQEYVLNLTVDPDADGQFAEIGPGLGGLVPYLAARAERGEIPKPIAIDTADFRSIREMIEYALLTKEVLGAVSVDTVSRAELLLGRCAVLLESPHIRFYNTTLGDALCAYPDLVGSADHLVELYGPTFYTSVEGKTRENMRQCAWNLLATEGRYHGMHCQ